MKYPVSGANTVAISPATASSNQGIGVSITAGRVFWLTGLWIAPCATFGPLIVCDATVGSTATTPQIVVPVPVLSAGDNIRVYEFPVPGVKFATNPVGHLDASGSVAIGYVGCAGYEE